MKRRLLAGVLAVALAILAGCGAGGEQTTAGGSTPPSSAANSSGTAAKRVAIVLPGLINDQSWNQAGYEGVQKAKAQGVEIAYTEKVPQAEQLEVFRNYARQGFSVVIGHGGEYMDAALQAAKDFPGVQFVVTNGTKSEKNVTSLALSYGDMGYLAGVLAGQMTRTKKVAVVSAQEIPIVQEALRAFKAGVARVAPDVEVKTTVTASWEDVDKARQAALALINSGVDVLWHLLDAADAGVMSAAEDKGVMVIGLYGDQKKLAPNAHIGAAFADASRVTYKAATEALDGKVHKEGVAEGVVSMGAYSDKVPQAVRDKVKEAEKELASGKQLY